MIDLLKNSFEKDKDKIAYIIDDEVLSYQELYESAQVLATYLVNEGEGPVVVYGHKSKNILISFIACLFAGRPYVPIDVFIPQDRIYRIIDETNPQLILTCEEFDHPAIKCIDPKLILKEGIKEEFTPKQQDSAYIIFTSGSTGIPKGVPISTHNLKNFTEWISTLPGLRTDKHKMVLNQASFSFDLSVADIYYALSNGHTLVGLNRDYTEVFELMKKYQINIAVMTPTFVKLCLLEEKFNNEYLKHLEIIYFCGEILDVRTVQKLWDRFPQLKIINAYGPTEATSAVSAILITKEMLNRNVLPVGDMNTCATDIWLENGEIVLGGDSVFQGYLNMNSSQCFKKNGVACYRTGDLGIIENNYLYCKGRKDRQIKYKGYRIELGEIEITLMNIPEIEECVVIAKKNPKDGQVKMLKAYIVGTIEVSEVKEQLKQKLPIYMLPKVVVKLPSLPMNNNGKIDRQKLEEL